MQALPSQRIAAHSGCLAPSRRGNAALRSPTSADAPEQPALDVRNQPTVIVRGVPGGYRVWAVTNDRDAALPLVQERERLYRRIGVDSDRTGASRTVCRTSDSVHMLQEAVRCPPR